MTGFKKKVLSFALVGTMALSSTGLVFAANPTEKFDKIVELGIIQGEEGNNPIPLDTLTRYRAFVLQLRLIGKLEEFQNYNHEGKETFKDASKYSPFVQKLSSYLKTHPEIGITGYEDDTLRPMEIISAKEYAIIMLSALGYEPGKDFTWETAEELASSLGIITTVSIDSKSINLKEAAVYTYDTLVTSPKNEKNTLGEKLGYVINDTLAPVIALDEFESTVYDAKVNLKGSVNEKSTVTINDIEVELKEDLTFEKEIMLEVGDNKVVVKATDASGNSSEHEVTIKREVRELTINDVISDSNKQVQIKFSNEVDPATLKAENFEIKNYNIGKIQLEDDKKTVTLILAGQSVFPQQSKQVISRVENVKDIHGNTVTKGFNIDFTSQDITLPKIVKVETEKNDEIRLTFSEPVQEAQAINNINYTLNGKRFVGNIKGYDYNTVILYSKNFEAKNVLEVKSIKDFNSLTMADQTVEFEYVVDNTAPEVVEISDVTLESMRIKFSEKIDIPTIKKENIKWAYSISSTSGKIATSIDKVDDTTIMVHFKGDNSLPPATVNVILNGIRDLSGNVIKEDTTIEVTATIDEARPTVVSVVTEYDGDATTTSNGNTKFTVTFSKKILDADSINNLSNNFEILDKDGKKVNREILLRDHYTTSTDKVEFTVKDLKDGDYTLVVKNIKDDTKLANKMLDSEHSFSIGNKRTPEVLNVFYEDSSSTDKLYIQYSETMNSTIADSTKYMIKKGGTWKKLADELDSNITTMRNNTFAIIPLKSDITAYSELEISLVENSAGTIINGNKVTFKLDEIKDINTTAPIIKHAEITNKNQIKIYLDKEITDAYYKDFWISNESKSVAQNVYNSQASNYNFETVTIKENNYGIDFNGNMNTNDTVVVSIVTINFSTDVFGANGKFKSGEDIFVYDNTDNIAHTQDAFGNKLAPSSAKAIDKTGAALQAVGDRINANLTGTEFVLEFDEAIVIGDSLNGYAANDLIITTNTSSILTPGVDYSVRVENGKLYVSLSQTMEGDYTVKTASKVNFLKDAAGNVIKAIDNVTIVKQQ